MEIELRGKERKPEETAEIILNFFNSKGYDLFTTNVQ